MNLNDKTVNSLIDYCVNFVDKVSLKNNYSNNISHLLYLIVPAFIIKYGFDNKEKILKTFEKVPIIINNKEEKIYQAFYTSIPFRNDTKIETKKYIVINYYNEKSLIELIDNLVHEYNHAINSINNEIKEDSDYIYIRTGLMYSKYSKNDFFQNSKDDSYILEEIINTKQTEDVINIINSLNNYDIKNDKLCNLLYVISKNVNINYNSSAYLLQSILCKELVNNKTLISVLSTNRFLGNIDEIDYFFDNITGIKGSYKQLIKYLNDSVKLEEKYSKSKLFKKNKLYKIKNIFIKAKEIVDKFNKNYHFK